MAEDISDNYNHGCQSSSTLPNYLNDVRSEVSSASTSYYTAYTSQPLDEQSPSPQLPTMEEVQGPFVASSNAPQSSQSRPAAPGAEANTAYTLAQFSDEFNFFYLDTHLIPYSVEHNDPHPDFKDIWLSQVGLEGNKHIPALPMAYKRESDEKRALYIRGVPFGYLLSEFEEIFAAYGKIDKCPAIIDVQSQETFRWVIMSKKIEAERVQKKIHQLRFQDLKLLATTALPPGRGLTIQVHEHAVEEGYVMPSECVFQEAPEETTVHGHPGPASNAKLVDLIEKEDPFPLDFLPHAPEYTPEPKNYTAEPQTAPAEASKRPADPATVSPKFINNIATPLQMNQLSYTGEILASRRKKKPIPPPLVLKPGESNFDAFRKAEVGAPSSERKKENIRPNNSMGTLDFLGVVSPQQSYASMSDHNYVGSWKDHEGYKPPRNPIVDELLKANGGPSKTQPQPNNGALVARLKNTTSNSSKSEAVKSEASLGPTLQPIAYEAPAAHFAPTALAARATSAAPVTPPQQIRPLPTQRTEPASVVPTIPAASVETGSQIPVSSWANIAGTASPNSRIIDLHPVAKNTQIGPRLKPVGRIPSIVNTRDSEPITEQMRVVFLLDLPNTLTLENVSAGVKEGPIRSIHFGMDEEKQSRYAAVVFQYAGDAAAFTAALLKERAEHKPDRFRFIVDVVRGEEAFPVDDVLRAMGPPTYASRRLTLVKASFFFMFGERQIRQFCEKVIDESAIQLIWLYNGGNATIVFADVGSAMTVKAAFDNAAATAGQPDRQPMIWSGLMTTYSKDPCVIPLELKTAMHE